MDWTVGGQLTQTTVTVWRGGGLGVKGQHGGGAKDQNEEKEEASTRERGALIIYSTSVYISTSRRRVAARDRDTDRD